ncbi:class I SAM-dependent methyltransferase [Mariniluteicoccus endophyticus]
MDAIDEVVLGEATQVAPTARRVVTVDDETGVLTARATAGHEQVAAYADSLLVERTLPGAATDLATALNNADLVLMRLPKALGALDETAGLVAAHAGPGVRLVAGGRVKHMTRGMNEVLARHFGEVRASLGVRKARALVAADPLPVATTDAWPARQVHSDLGLTLCAHGACFGGTKVDLGTRLLLSALDVRTPTAVDLGCGNGTISAWLASRGVRVTATDESRAACLSTRATAEANGVGELVEVRRADGLEGVADGSVETIVCNPPFHMGTAKDSSTALTMIESAGRVLRPGGELWLVWNAHLPYLPSLRRHVGRTEIVARDPRFVVTCSTARLGSRP